MGYTANGYREGQRFNPPGRSYRGLARQASKAIADSTPDRDATAYSALENSRLTYQIEVPAMLDMSAGSTGCAFEEREPTTCTANEDKIKEIFKTIYGQKSVGAVGGPVKRNPLKVGCVLSGGQAAGGHNCICGLFDYTTWLHPDSQVYGFIGGPRGVMENRARLLTRDFVDKYRNTGGFDMLTAGRDKIETEDQFAMSRRTVEALDMDGLVVIGGDDSNTNAALLAENFKAHNLKTKVLGLPKTIDGDLKNEYIETSFGFDTAAKLYAECVGAIQVDCISTRKTYHFIRLMGREASHLTLEVAFQTKPNMAFIGEEVRAENMSLADVTNKICDLVEARAKNGMHHGVILIPEGLIDFIPEVSVLIKEINEVLAKGTSSDDISAELTPATRTVFHYLPPAIQQQLLLDRDPHGNVQVAKIESERLFSLLSSIEMEKRKKEGKYEGKFSVQCHYFGYEGRCTPPSLFDCRYCYALGLTASALIADGRTGMIASLRGLTKPCREWEVMGMPLTQMMNVERRKGKDKAVIRKALTDLNQAPFKAYKQLRDQWAREDRYSNPGPIQYSGTAADNTTYHLRYEQLGVDKILPAHQATTSSALEEARKKWTVPLPAVLEKGFAVKKARPIQENVDSEAVLTALPKTGPQPLLDVEASTSPITIKKDLRMGIVFSGRQTPGGHSAVGGLYRFIKTQCGPDAKLFGFKNGTHGMFANEHIEITDKIVEEFANTGGFQMLGRSADVIRGKHHIEATIKTCKDLDLDGLAILGGPISNSDAAVLAEEFVSRNLKTCVIGIPGTIDGDIKNRYIETSIGFDTATKVYSSLIGHLSTDSASARKYYYFVRVMGRAPSHIALECALQTQPNLTLIGEEIEAKRKGLMDVVSDIADVVEERARLGKNFGVFVIPEGLVEYIPEMNMLLNEVASLFKAGVPAASMAEKLTPWNAALLAMLPEVIRKEVLLTPEASTGRAQLNQIETERLLADLVAEEMKRRKEKSYRGSFSAVSFYLGYQARSTMPSNFDCVYANALGYTTGALVAAQATGYLAAVHGLTRDVSTWHCGGVPFAANMITIQREGTTVPVWEPAKVDLRGAAFVAFDKMRDAWKLDDLYRNPGPLQFTGPLADLTSHTLMAEQASVCEKKLQVEAICNGIKQSCGFGVTRNYLNIAANGLKSLSDILSIVRATEEESLESHDRTHLGALPLDSGALENMPDQL